jgi:hypothetical protein
LIVLDELLTLEVPSNQYGDCKDKDTLLEALLHAKGFSTAPALVGAGIAPVPEVPSPAVFNHVITTVNLPGGRLWLDSTPPAARYQLLSAVIRDQKALIVPAEGQAALETTPANAPYPFSARFGAKGTLDTEGKVSAKMAASYRDDDEMVIRAVARSVAPADWDKASQYLSSLTGFGGTTSNTQFTNVDDISLPIVMTYDYNRHPFGDWDNLRIGGDGEYSADACGSTAHIAESLVRLKVPAARPYSTSMTEAFQNLRTYHVDRPSGASGWGTFRLEITTGGVIESQQMSGEQQHLGSIKPVIDGMKFAELLPSDSKAHLLRSAVVSCSMGKTCDVVLVPDGGLHTEGQ